MTETKNKRRLSTAALIFAILLITGFVYAKMNGVLTIQGTATAAINNIPSVELQFVIDPSDVTVYGEDQGDDEFNNPLPVSTGTVTLLPDPLDSTPNQIMEIVAVFTKFDDTLTFPFSVENTGVDDYDQRDYINCHR